MLQKLEQTVLLWLTFLLKKLLVSEKNAKEQSRPLFNLAWSYILTHFYSLSYVPLIAPSTTLSRIKFLASIADTFIYVVSKVRPLQVFVGFSVLTLLPDGNNRVFRQGGDE